MYESLSDNGKLLSIWSMQKGKCPNCKQPITLSTDWDIHHVIPKSKGGDNRSSNFMMLHINCHK
ncbi:CRISPR-associated endonuclease Cas9 [Orientia tsutsugamushi]|nr:CRISPR-associated endonuclease Cas9 [Orientia tsutsugamushi]